MKVILGFNDIKQDGMGAASTTLMRALKYQGIEVQPIHAWHDIDLPGYEEEFHPIFIHDSEVEPKIEDVIEKMISAVNDDLDCNIFTHFGSPNWACILPFLRKDIRIVVSIHSITPSALKTAFAYRERVSAYVPVSWEAENKIRKKLKSSEQLKVYRITNVVDVERFTPKQDYADDGVVKIVFFGRVEDVTKGCDKIAPIAKILKSKGLKFEWNIYGYFHWGFESRFYELLQENDVEDVVLYKGCLNPDEIPTMLLQHDIMVMPSNHEGFGLALAEAMCVGLPCVVSRLHDVTDMIIEEGKEGELCERNNINDFAEKIYRLAISVDLREKIGRAARVKVENNFSIDCQGIGYKYVFTNAMTSNNYKMIKTPSLINYKQPEIVKPHILARILPLWLKKILKKIV